MLNYAPKNSLITTVNIPKFIIACINPIINRKRATIATVTYIRRLGISHSKSKTCNYVSLHTRGYRLTLIDAHQSIVLKFFTYYAQTLTYYAGIIPLCFWSPIMLKIMLA